MQERRQQISTVRRQEASLVPLFVGVALLAIVGSALWYLWSSDEVAADGPVPGTVAAGGTVTSLMPEPVTPPVTPTPPPPVAVAPVQPAALPPAPPSTPEPSVPPPTQTTVATPAPVPPTPPVAETAPQAPSAPVPPPVPPVAETFPAAPPAPTVKPEQLIPPADPARAFADATAAAAQGEPEAQFQLAQAYRNGWGTKADPVRALAWYMQAGARGHKAAIIERDQMLSSLDDTAKVQADSLSRSLSSPMPAGWLVDLASGVRVWSPSWYRNGTFKVGITGGSAGGGVHGPARVTLTATLHGRSDRTFEGVFSGGLMLDERLRTPPGWPLQLLETDEIRVPLPANPNRHPAIRRLWRQTKMTSMLIESCPADTLYLYAVMAPEFAAIEDARAKEAAVGAAQELNTLCPPQPQAVVRLSLLPSEHNEAVERGMTSYAPRLADVQLYGLDKPVQDWSISIDNHARQAHVRREQEAEQQRKRNEREQKEARDVAAARSREMPDIRGFKLGLTFDAFKAAIGTDAVTWLPKLKDDHVMPAHASFEQKVTLRDGAAFTGVFASAQNGSRLMALVYEQNLRDGPDADTMRQQLRAKYGPPDDEAGGGSTLTWWLRSSIDDEPKGAFLRVRIETDQNKRVALLRLTISDYGLSRRDEVQAAAARRQAERDAFEKQKSDKPRF